MISVKIKRGDTFVLECTCSVDNIPQDVTNWVISSKVRHVGTNFVDTLITTKIDAVNGVYQLKKQDTTAWPIKTLLCDIQYVIEASGQVISTETFEIPVVADVTY